MKIKILILLSLIFFSCNHVDETRNKAYDDYSNENYNNSVRLFEQLRSDYNESHEYYKESTLRIGEIYFNQGKLNDAEKKFKEVLKAENRIRQFFGDFRTILYPRANDYYKNEACIGLAEISYLRGDYKKALELLESAEEVFENFSCGFGLFEEEFRKDTLFVKYHLELGNIDFILNRLEGSIFNLSKGVNYNGVEKIAELMKLAYNKEYIDHNLKALIDSVHSEKVIVDDIETTRYNTIWFGEEIKLLDLNSYNFLDRYYYDYKIHYDSSDNSIVYEEINEEKLKEMCINKIINSEIFKELKIPTTNNQ